MIHRRTLLAGLLMGGTALALSGCTTVKVGTITTITLSVASIEQYAQAGLNAAKTVTSALALFPSLIAYTTPLATVEAALQVALDAFTNVVKGDVTIVYNAATIKTKVDSVLSAIQDVAGQIAAIIEAMGKASVKGISSSTVSSVELAYNALKTVISVFQALLGETVAMTMSPTEGPYLAMSEQQALRILRA